MNDLTTRIRQTLQERAGQPVFRKMPAGTARGIRRRQTRFVVGVAALTTVALVGAVGVLRLLPRGAMGNGPASGPLVPPSHPIEEVPPGWPRVDVGAPDDAPYVMPSDVADAIGGVEVIASGTVETALFSYMGWFGGREEEGLAGPCIGFAGPWGGGAPPTDPALQGFGGIVSGTCAHWHEDPVPTAVDLYLAGQRDPPTVPGIAANYGFVSERVARLEVELGGMPPQEIPILDGPASWGGIRAFLFFPPRETEGVLVAYDGDGRPLARVEICEAVAEGASGGCGGVAEQLAPPLGPGT